jgi:AmmeMemoRadiSam system protein B
MLRNAQVAHQFYPGDPDVLERTVEKFLSAGAKTKVDALAVIAPHAGYIYSGQVAGNVFAEVNVHSNVVLIGPNHTGLGERASVMTSGKWQIPTGTVDINEGLARSLLDSCGLFLDDYTAHMGEHSLEVELPFIHYLNRNARIVPITVMPASFNQCSEMGKAIADVILACDEKVLMVVSSDMNHYESDDVTRKKDNLAIDRALELDADGLLQVTSKNDITMCGVVPSAIAIVAARQLGAKGARLVSYATSGDASGDYGHVVGYAGIVIE